MNWRLILVALTLSCGVTISPARADPHPRGFSDYELNGPVAPVTEDGVTTFHIVDRGCSDFTYGDGRGESDCLNGNIKSVLKRTPNAEIGAAYQYAFDVWVDPSLDFSAAYEDQSVGFIANGMDSRLRVASWEGPSTIKSFVYMLKLDSTRGLTFMGNVCQPAAALGEWVHFDMKVRWAADDRGWVKVTCDDRLVYFDEAVRTNVSPQCYLINECNPEAKIDPRAMNFLVGPALNGLGHSWKENGWDSQFIKIQPDGITVKMKNITVVEGAQLYSDEDKRLVSALQQRLNEFGCDVGAPDGMAGPRTKQAALICRAFPEGDMPAELDVMTLPVFVDLYSREDVADLPPGKLPDDPDSDLLPREVVIKFLGIGNHTAPRDPEVQADFHGPTDLIPGAEKVDFLVNGRYDFAADTFASLFITLEKPTDPALESALKACGDVGIVVWDDGSAHVELRPVRQGKHFPLRGAKCALHLLPEGTREETALLIDHFADLAVGMVLDNTLPNVGHDGLRSFLDQVARGKIHVGRPADR